MNTPPGGSAEKPRARKNVAGEWELHYADGRVEPVLASAAVQAPTMRVNGAGSVPPLPTDRDGWISYHPGLQQTNPDLAVSQDVLKNATQTRIEVRDGGPKILFLDASGSVIHTIPSGREALRLYSGSGDPMLSDAMNDVRRNLAAGQQQAPAATQAAAPASEGQSRQEITSEMQGIPGVTVLPIRVFEGKGGTWPIGFRKDGDKYEILYAERMGKKGEKATYRLRRNIFRKFGDKDPLRLGGRDFVFEEDTSGLLPNLVAANVVPVSAGATPRAATTAPAAATATATTAPGAAAAVAPGTPSAALAAPGIPPIAPATLQALQEQLDQLRATIAGLAAAAAVAPPTAAPAAAAAAAGGAGAGVVTPVGAGAAPQQPGQGAAAAPTQQPAAPVGTPNTGTLVAAPAPGTFRASQVANGQTVQIGPAPGGAGGFLVRTPQGWSHYPTQAAAQAAFQAAVAQAPAPGVPPAAAAAAPPAPAAPGVPPATLQALQQQLSQLQATLASLVASAGATPVATPTPAAAAAAGGGAGAPPGGAGGAPPGPAAPPGPVAAPAPAAPADPARYVSNGDKLPLTMQPVGLMPVPGFVTQNGYAVMTSGDKKTWLFMPGLGYYEYAHADPQQAARMAHEAMVYYSNTLPLHTAAVQMRAAPGGQLHQAMNAQPQAGLQTIVAMRSIRQIIAADRAEKVAKHGFWWGHIRSLLRREYVWTAIFGAAAGATLGAMTGGLVWTQAGMLGAGVGVARSFAEKHIAQRILSEKMAEAQRAGDTTKLNELANEYEGLSLLRKENFQQTVLVNAAIGAAAAAGGNYFFNQTELGGQVKQGIVKGGKWFLGLFSDTTLVPAPVPVKAAAAVVPPPAPRADKAAGRLIEETIKAKSRAPGAGAAAFVDGPRCVPAAPRSIYIQGCTRVRETLVDERIRMHFKGKGGKEAFLWFVESLGYDPRPGKGAYVPQGPSKISYVPSPTGPQRAPFIAEIAPVPRTFTTAPYVIGGDESVWSFAQQEMQKGVLSRAANMLPSNLHDSFINAMHDTLDKTPKFKSLLLGMPDAANVQWNKIPNGTKVDFAALLSNQEFLDEFRKTATSLRYGSLWRALTQNGNTPERFFAVVRSLYVPAPTRAGGIIA